MVCPGDDIASIYSLSPNMKKTLASKPSATPTELRGTSSIEQRGRGRARWLVPGTSWLLAVWWPRGAWTTAVQPELAGGCPPRPDVLTQMVVIGVLRLPRCQRKKMLGPCGPLRGVRVCA